jgi:hypothetical protein
MARLTTFATKHQGVQNSGNNISRVIAVNRHTLNQNACTAERTILQIIAIAKFTKIS